MSLVNYRANNHPQQIAKRGAKDDVDDRRTPWEFMRSMYDRFGEFTLDAAASHENTKANGYFDRESDGLSRKWWGRVWCNPPYSNCGAWVQKAWDEWNRYDADAPDLIVMLLPANRCEQGWWQDLVEPYRDREGSPLRVEFLRGRMRFERPGWEKPAKGDRPPFGCCLLIWGS